MGLTKAKLFTLLSALILASALAVGVCMASGRADYRAAQAAGAAWDGTTVDTEWAGSGTQADPYLISNGAELAGLAVRVQGGATFSDTYFLQTESIDLGGKEWMPIGSVNSVGGTDGNKFFNGVYDGDDLTISNISITRYRDKYSGLFGLISGNAQILNIQGSGKVDIQNALGSSSEGGTALIVGYATSNTVIDHCVVTAELRYISSPSTTTPESLNVGGIVGYSHGIIRNCSAKADITVSKEYSGNTGYIGVGVRVGAVAARANIIENCAALSGTLDVTARVSNEGGSRRGNPCVGGIVGMLNTRMDNCYVGADMQYRAENNSGVDTGKGERIENCDVGALIGSGGTANDSYYPNGYDAMSEGVADVNVVTYSGRTLSAAVSGETDVLTVMNGWVNTQATDYFQWKYENGSDRVELIAHHYMPTLITAPTLAAEGEVKFVCSDKDVHEEDVVKTVVLPKLDSDLYTVTVGESKIDYRLDTKYGYYTYSLARIELKDAWLITEIGDSLLSGSEVTFDIVVKNGAVTLAEDTDYTVAYIDNDKPGVATLTIMGQNFYKGTITKTFKIFLALKSEWFQGEIADVALTGTSATVPVVIKDGSTTLAEGTDYTVAYTGNDRAGTATLTVTGKGIYKGSFSKTFRVLQALSSKWFEGTIADAELAGDAVTVPVVIKNGGVTLIEGTDYTVTYKDNDRLGTATITVTGNGFYTGSIVKVFRIVDQAPKTVPDSKTNADLTMGLLIAWIVLFLAAIFVFAFVPVVKKIKLFSQIAWIVYTLGVLVFAGFVWSGVGAIAVWVFALLLAAVVAVYGVFIGSHRAVLALVAKKNNGDVQ